MRGHLIITEPDDPPAPFVRTGSRMGVSDVP